MKTLPTPASHFNHSRSADMASRLNPNGSLATAGGLGATHGRRPPPSRLLPLCACLLAAGQVYAAAPTLSTPLISVNAGTATLSLQSSASGTGYFTLLPGANADCGSGTQIQAGTDSGDSAAYRIGSLPLTAATPAGYTVRNLAAGSDYTACFSADDGATLQSTAVTANFTTTTAMAGLSTATWSGVGSAGFSTGVGERLSLSFAPDGTPYVAYVDSGNDYKVTVMKFSAGTWSVVGSAGFSGSARGIAYPSLSFAPDGTPYVAYEDYGNSGKATVMKFSAGSWRVVGSAGFSAGQSDYFVTGQADYTSLSFAPDGTPYVAYQDAGHSNKATVMKFSAGAWSVVGSAGFSASLAKYTALSFAPDGTPYVAYKDYGNSNKATVMKFSGGSWRVVGSAGFSAGGVDSTSLSFAPDGTPYVAYTDNGNGGNATVMKFSAGTWSTVGSAGFSADAAYYTSLSFAPDGTPYVAYKDYGNGNKATVMKFSGGSWSVVGSVGFSAGIADHPSLSFAPDGTFHVAYKDGGNNDKLTVMKLVPDITAPGYSSASVNAAKTVITLTFDETLVNGLADLAALKAAITFAADGVNYGALAADDTVSIVGATVTVTFAAPLAGRTNKVRVAANSLKDAAGNLVTSLTTTPAIAVPSVMVSGASASSATLSLQTSETGTGYFTLLLGANAACGTGYQIQAGRDSNNNVAYRRGSLPLVAATPADYTVRNLGEGTAYTVCFSTQTTYATTNFTTMAMAGLSNSTWSAVGSADFTGEGGGYSKLSFAPDGTPYVAYLDESNGAKATVMKFSGGAWSVVGSAAFSTGRANHLSLSFAPDNTPYVVYMDGGNGDKATVMKFSAGAWSVVGSAIVSTAGWADSSLAFAPDGAPYVAYGGTHLVKFSGGSWNVVGSADFAAFDAFTSLAFAPDGTPYVAYRDERSKATVRKFSGGSWSLVGSASFSAGQATDLSLSFAPDGTPWLAYQDPGNGHGNDNSAMVMMFSAGAWSVVGGDNAGGTEYVFNGAPYVVYSDKYNGATVRKFSGGSWGEEVGGRIPMDSVTSLAFAPDGTAYVVGRGLGFSGFGTGRATVMKLSDITAPSYSSASINGANTVVTLTFNEALVNNLADLAALKAAITFAADGVNFSALAAGDSVAIVGSTVTVTFVAPLSGSANMVRIAANSLKDAGGNVVAGLTTTVAVAVQPPPSVMVAGVGAGSATLSLQSSETGAGYFTLLPGADTACGAGAQIRAGQGSNGGAAYRIGSLPLVAATAANYTMHNLGAGAVYTVCFVADDGTTLQAASGTANLTTAAMVSLSNPAWSEVGSADFSTGSAAYTSLAFAPDGTPYVAYQEGGSRSKVTVKKFSAGAWSVVGGAEFSAGQAEYTSLSFAPDGTPYVAYSDSTRSFKATVMKFSGGTWSVLGSSGFSAGQATYTSLSFAPDGTPYVAYKDNGNDYKATVMKFSAGSWRVVGNAGFSAGTANYTALSFAPDGTPYVAYKDVGNGDKATVMKLGAGIWSVVGSAGFSAGGADYLSLSFAPDGTPHVVYSDVGNSGKATVMKFSGGTWSVVGSGGFSAGQAAYTSLSVAPDGTPYVAYKDVGNSNKATVMKFGAGSWSVAGSAAFSAEPIGYTSLSFAPDGTPYVAYQDFGFTANKTIVMKLGAPPDITASAYSSASINGAYTVVTLTFDEALGNNLTDLAALKAAITFAADGVNFAALSAGDSVAIVGATVTVTFAAPLSGSTNKLRIAANSLKDVAGNVLASAVTTAALNMADTTPATFSFTAVTNAALSTSTESAAITIVNSNATAISIVGGEYAVSTDNGATWGAYTAGAGTVNLNDRVKVRLTSSANYSTTATATLTIGGASAAFSVTTQGAPVDDPDPSAPPALTVINVPTGGQTTLINNTSVTAMSGSTLTIPAGASVSGVAITLAAPVGGAAPQAVTLNIGSNTLTVTPTGANGVVTLKTIAVNGVPTLVLAVSSGTVTVSGSPGQTLLAVGNSGGVIVAGTGGGVVSQHVDTGGATTMSVTSGYIVLPAGTFSSLSGGAGTGNGFAAIKDGIVWAGETTEFDKNGHVVSIYLGTKTGSSGDVGDDVVPGGNKFVSGEYRNNAFIPRLSGTPLRLNGAKLDESLFKALNQMLGTTTTPATPGQSAQGVMSFHINGDSAADQKAQSTLNFNLKADQITVIPTRRIRVDTSRADGVSLSSEGDVEVAAGGLVAIFAPSVGDPQVFAEKVAQALPGATGELRWNGTWKVMTGDGGSYVGRPAWNRQTQTGNATFASLANGNVIYHDGGYSQMLVADFHDYTTLQATFAKELNDAKLTVQPNMDGTATAKVNGKTYTLTPQWRLVKAADITGKPAWWLDNGVVYIKNADGTAQGFSVK